MSRGSPTVQTARRAGGSEHLISELRELVAWDLKPHVQDIDVGGEYPEAFMRRIGSVGGFRQGTPTELGGTGKGIEHTIRVMEEVSKECLSTGFCVWCQTVCAWYIQNGGSDHLKESVLPAILNGRTLAGTGLSNPMKHFSGMEKINITAERRTGGYLLNGAVPWVSNVNTESQFAVVANLSDEEGYMMAVLPGDAEGMKMGSGGQFIALEGSRTHSFVLKDVFVPEELVLASPAEEYIARIRPGFILTQTGFAFGVVESCIGLIKRAKKKDGRVNGFLDEQAESLESDLQAARRRAYALAGEIGCGMQDTDPEITRGAVEARLEAAQLSLRASQAAMLHMGSSGYRLHSTAERKLRESYFVAVVTPALKHLRKILHDMGQTSSERSGT